MAAIHRIGFRFVVISLCAIVCSIPLMFLLLNMEISPGTDPQTLPILFVIWFYSDIGIVLGSAFMRRNADAWISIFSLRKFNTAAVLACSQTIITLIWLFSQNNALLLGAKGAEFLFALLSVIEYRDDIKHYLRASNQPQE